MRCPGIKPESVMCKASVLLSVQFLWPFYQISMQCELPSINWGWYLFNQPNHKVRYALQHFLGTKWFMLDIDLTPKLISKHPSKLCEEVAKISKFLTPIVLHSLSQAIPAIWWRNSLLPIHRERDVWLKNGSSLCTDIT